MNSILNHLDLNTIWFLMVGTLFTGYAVLDGFDLGVGALHLFTKTDEHRRIMLNSIGPVWDGNEVWLVTGGGALFAAFPDVYCKMSGLVTEADHKLWTREQLKPYIDHVIDCFGFDRIIYGGDWPVATQATDYPRWVETLLWAVEGCTQTELKKLFHDNAISFYKLD